MDQPVHLFGMLDEERTLRLYVDGEQVAEAEGLYVSRLPNVRLEIGSDVQSMVGEYGPDNAFPGELEDVRIYWGALDEGSIRDGAGRRD